MKTQAHSQLNHRAFPSVLFFVLLFSFGCAKEDFQPVASIEAKANTAAALWRAFVEDRPKSGDALSRWDDRGPQNLIARLCE